MRKSFIVVSFLVLIVIVSCAVSKATSGILFENLKVLPQTTNKQQMDSVMKHFSESLGKNCDFCHVQKDNEMKDWDFASDKNEHKIIAREMMVMTNDINEKYFHIKNPGQYGVRLEVNCYTCHKGRAHPQSRIPAAKTAAPPFIQQ